MTLTFSPLRAMFMTYSHAKVQGQQSVSSEDRAETNGWTDRGHCITCPANAVGNKCSAVFAFSALMPLAGWQKKRATGPSNEALVWLAVWSEMQMTCIRSSWCHCHSITSASIKLRKVHPSGSGLPRLFWKKVAKQVLLMAQLSRETPGEAW